MVHQGARVPGGDYFDDILGDHRDAGIHQGTGLDDHDRISEQLPADGIIILSRVGAVSRHYIEDVCDYCSPFYVFQEVGAQLCSAVRTFD